MSSFLSDTTPSISARKNIKIKSLFRENSDLKRTINV